VYCGVRFVFNPAVLLGAYWYREFLAKQRFAAEGQSWERGIVLFWLPQ